MPRSSDRIRPVPWPDEIADAEADGTPNVTVVVAGDDALRIVRRLAPGELIDNPHGEAAFCYVPVSGDGARLHLYGFLDAPSLTIMLAQIAPAADGLILASDRSDGGAVTFALAHILADESDRPAAIVGGPKLLERWVHLSGTKSAELVASAEIAAEWVIEQVLVARGISGRRS